MTSGRDGGRAGRRPKALAADPSKNPFRPGAAVPPTYLAGRGREQTLFRRSLDAAPGLPLNLRVTGLRGVGKSVLLQVFARQAAECGWATTAAIQLETRHNREPSLTNLLREWGAIVRERHSIRARTKRAVSRMRKGATVSWKVEDITIGVDLGGGTEVDLADDLRATVEAVARADYCGYLILLDEAQVLSDSTSGDGRRPLSALLTAVNSLQSEGLALGLVMCGLPTLKSNLQRARSYSERMFRGVELGSLSDSEAEAALTRPLVGTGLSWGRQALADVVQSVEGFPYFVQLWGDELWEAATSREEDEISPALVRELEPSIYGRLDRDFYDSRLASLTPVQRELLLETARCSYPPLRLNEVHVVTQRSTSSLNSLFSRFVDHGILYRSARGEYEYTGPQFHQYLQRRLQSTADLSRRRDFARDLLPSRSYSTALPFDVSFNSDLMSDLLDSHYYYFSGVSARHVPVRTTFLADKGLSLGEVKLILTDPHSRSSLLHRASGRLKSPRYQGHTLEDLVRSVRWDVYSTLVALYDSRRTKISVGLCSTPLIERTEILDAAAYVSAYYTEYSAGQEWPQTLRYPRRTVTYARYLEEFATTFANCNTVLSFEDVPTEVVLKQYLSELSWTEHEYPIADMRASHAAFSQEFGAALGSCDLSRTLAVGKVP